MSDLSEARRRIRKLLAKELRSTLTEQPDYIDDEPLIIQEEWSNEVKRIAARLEKR